MDADPAIDHEQPRPTGDGAKERTRRIRWKVVAGCMACFALLWAVISIRMGSGDDPALGAESPAGSAPSSRFSEGFPEPGGAPEDFLFGGGDRDGDAPGGGLGEGVQPEGPSGPEEGLAPLHSRQS